MSRVHCRLDTSDMGHAVLEFTKLVALLGEAFEALVSLNDADAPVGVSSRERTIRNAVQDISISLTGCAVRFIR